MNQWLREKTQFLKGSLALLVSGIGTALTSIVVYSELDRLQAPPTFYAVAFVLGMLPGMLSSYAAGRWGQRWHLRNWVIGTQILGLVLLTVPAWGARSGNLVLLVMAEALGSTISGFLVPGYQAYVRRHFRDDELPALSRYETFFFTTQFVLGQIVGTCLYRFLGRDGYLLLDWLSYAAALVLLIAGGAFGDGDREPPGSETRSFDWRRLSSQQKRAFLMIPLMSIVCAPLMALLPAAGARLDGLNYYPVAICLLYLAARGLGQLIGPWVTRRWNFDALLADSRFLFVCLGLYWVLYAVVFHTRSVGLAFSSIVLAHCFSNLVYVAGAYGLNRHFDALEIGVVSARHYQLCVLAVSASALFGGFCTWSGNFDLALLASLFGLMGWAWHLQKSNDLSIAISGEQRHVV